MKKDEFLDGVGWAIEEMAMIQNQEAAEHLYLTCSVKDRSYLKKIMPKNNSEIYKDYVEPIFNKLDEELLN